MKDVESFIKRLKTSNPLKLDKVDLRKIKVFVNSNGCTFVRDIFKDACILHDFYYMTKRDLENKNITRKYADYLFLEYMIHTSSNQFERGLAHIFWAGVRVFGWYAWK